MFGSRLPIAAKACGVNSPDREKQIYGEDIEVAFVQYLRAEQKFAGVDELQGQIRRDAELARQIYRSPEKEGR